MIPQSLTDALEHGLLAAVVLVILLPFLVGYWILRRLMAWEY